MENEVLQRLRLFIKSRGLTIKLFSKSIEIPESTFKTMFNRGTSPSVDTLTKITNVYPDLSLQWILTGKGEMYKESSSNRISVNAGNNNTGIISHIGGSSPINNQVTTGTTPNKKISTKLKKQTLEIAILEDKIKELNIRLQEKDDIIRSKDKLITTLEEIITILKDKS